MNEARFQITRIQRRLTAMVLESLFAGTLENDWEQIPRRLIPRSGSSYRCCIHRDRAVLRYRALALMGKAIVPGTEDDFGLAEEYRKGPGYAGGIPLTVIDIACESCPHNTYQISPNCRGCVARPCTTVCPKGAVSVHRGHAEIDESKCVKCGKCAGVCPFKAIYAAKAPCREACPVGALETDKEGHMTILEDKCIACGKCLVSCPFGAIAERSQILEVARLLKEGKRVAVLVAPAAAGQFPGTMNQLAGALRRTGFAGVWEAALGADMVLGEESAEFLERKTSGLLPMTSSCCPAGVALIRKHLPEWAVRISHTPSPMVLTAGVIREKDPGTVVVFAGPCLAKREEAHATGSAEYVITFEELGALFLARRIMVEDVPESPWDNADAGCAARSFACSGAVAAGIAGAAGPVRTETVNGIDRKTAGRMKLLGRGGTETEFIELMACEHGCIGGPGVIANVRQALVRREDYRSGVNQELPLEECS